MSIEKKFICDLLFTGIFKKIKILTPPVLDLSIRKPKAKGRGV